MKLLKKYKTKKAISEAPVKEIAETAGVSDSVALELLDMLRQ